MTELQNYIEFGGGYKEGVLILARLDSKCIELRELNKYIDKRFAPTIAQELLKNTLLRYYKISQSVIDTSPQETVTKVEPVLEVETPLIILQLRAEQRLLRDERRAIHYTLEDTADQSERASKAQQIRSLSKRIDAIFNQLDDWELNGTIPSVATVGDARQGGLEVMELMKKAKYFRERISRLKDWINDSKTPQSKKERHKTELTLKKSELSVIEQTLETLKNPKK